MHPMNGQLIHAQPGRIVCGLLPITVRHRWALPRLLDLTQPSTSSMPIILSLICHPSILTFKPNMMGLMGINPNMMGVMGSSVISKYSIENPI